MQYILVVHCTFWLESLLCKTCNLSSSNQSLYKTSNHGGWGNLPKKLSNKVTFLWLIQLWNNRYRAFFSRDELLSVHFIVISCSAISIVIISKKNFSIFQPSAVVHFLFMYKINLCPSILFFFEHFQKTSWLPENSISLLECLTS